MTTFNKSKYIFLPVGYLHYGLKYILLCVYFCVHKTIYDKIVINNTNDNMQCIYGNCLETSIQCFF